ncbi:MAG: hypothetical protein M3Y21_02320 [Candidatus Eremiobacteraeota bacterium]|nr:hypothetical protein [Candidatus Eremiobacteraeota bacterium]
MKNISLVLSLSIASILLGGCSQPKSPIAVVDVQRLSQNWPKYINVSNQLAADQAAITQNRQSSSQKVRAELDLQKKYAGIQSSLANEIKNAATQVAGSGSYKLVVTKASIGYGGTDITQQVEKIMNITERATPSP